MKNVIAIVLGTVMWLWGYQSAFAQGMGIPERVRTLEEMVAALVEENSGQEGVIADLVKQNLVLTKKVACVSGASGTKDFIFDGCNVHIRNGVGTTDSINGVGNLIVGYNAERVLQSNKTGSHNLIIGDGHNYHRFGGLVVGKENTISGAYATVSGGSRSEASGLYSTVSGGRQNVASGDNSSVTGGVSNTASEFASSVTGGERNEASGNVSTVSGGMGRDVEGQGDWRAGDLFESD